MSARRQFRLGKQRMPRAKGFGVAGFSAAPQAVEAATEGRPLSEQDGTQNVAAPISKALL
jgi:hypothetical protein